MKNILSCALLILMMTYCLAQSSAFFEYDESVRAEQVSVANVWFGAKVSHAITDGDNSLSKNFLVAGKLLYSGIKTDKFGIPVAGSLAPTNIDPFNGESGFNLGVHPYYYLGRGASTTWVAHGAAMYKIIPESDFIENSVEQLRIVGGVEGMFRFENFTFPATLGITPVWLLHSIADNVDLDDTFGVEITGIMPINGGLGLFAEYWKPFKGLQGAFRLGVIIKQLVK